MDVNTVQPHHHKTMTLTGHAKERDKTGQRPLFAYEHREQVDRLWSLDQLKRGRIIAIHIVRGRALRRNVKSLE